MAMTQPMLVARGVEKAFVLHTQGGVRLPVLTAGALEVAAGECVALTGASGSGKSTLLRMLYGNYGADAGAIVVDGVDLATAPPREILEIRRTTLGYVSQFLHVVPRVPTIDVVTEPALAQGKEVEEARAMARTLLARLNLPERLWSLSPVTFSGGEQQRVNIARGFIGAHRVLLVDEPTASLDAANRDVVLDLIREKKAAGVALVGIFHDEAVRAAVCDRRVDVTGFSPGLEGGA